jgi:hypothetical protein
MTPSWKPLPIHRPYRIMVAGSALESFFATSPEEKTEKAMPRFKRLLAEWEELGARVVASMCDDVFQVGPTAPPRWAWYLLFDVDDLDVAAAMVQATREEVDGVRPDQYFRFELRVGRPFWAREEAAQDPLASAEV